MYKWIDVFFVLYNNRLRVLWSVTDHRFIKTNSQVMTDIKAFFSYRPFVELLVLIVNEIFYNRVLWDFFYILYLYFFEIILFYLFLNIQNLYKNFSVVSFKGISKNLLWLTNKNTSTFFFRAIKCFLISFHRTLLKISFRTKLSLQVVRWDNKIRRISL